MTTYAILLVSPSTYNEIRGLLSVAGYDDQFKKRPDGTEIIDMTGIALKECEGLTVGIDLAKGKEEGLARCGECGATWPASEQHPACPNCGAK